MKRIACIFLALVLLLTGCASAKRSGAETVFAMDTVMDLQVWGKDAQKALRKMKEEITALESVWSATKQDSLITRLNMGEDVALTQPQQELLQQAEELSARTRGLFDPKLGGYIRAWGFYDKQYKVPDEEDLERIRPQWDLGGIVKGYAGDRLTEILDTFNIDRAILNLGGNIQTYGEKPDGEPWKIAIQHPDGGTLGTVSVRGTMAVVTSGDYQRYFEQDGKVYHHIIDPRSGYPADSGLTSVTVICKDGTLADALSTAFFVMGMEKAVDHWQKNRDFGMVLLTKDGKLYATEDVALTDCQYEVIPYEK